MTLTQNPTAQNPMSYQAASKVNKPTKSGIRVISEMSTPSILWYAAKKHQTGLWKTAAIVQALYIFSAMTNHVLWFWITGLVG